MSDPTALLVLAKEPLPGRAKTRLTPPCTPEQAASLARAALEDTLAAAAATRRPARRVLVLDGRPGDWVPPSFAVIPQRGDGLAERLASAFEDAGAPALLVGMDTPQVTPARLDGALERLADPELDAVLGHAPDGGYWAIGLARADRAVFQNVPMSTPDTGAQQAARLASLGLRVGDLGPLRDVDTLADAALVAAEAPAGRFARQLRAIEPSLAGAPG